MATADHVHRQRGAVNRGLQRGWGRLRAANFCVGCCLPLPRSKASHKVACLATACVQLSARLRSSLEASAMMSKAAYSDPETLRGMWARREPPFAAVASCPVHVASPEGSSEDTQAYVWRDGEEPSPTVNVAIRGTATVNNAMSDVEAITVPIAAKTCPGSPAGVLVHEGFYRQFASIDAQLARALADAGIRICGEPECGNGPRLHFSGHSSGAAVGQIAAAVYAERFPHLVVSCHTIGSPRTGNAEFVAWFDRRVVDGWRVVNELDPVPRVPLRPVWVHAGLCLRLRPAARATPADEGGVEGFNEGAEVTAVVESADVPWQDRLIDAMTHVDCEHLIRPHSCEEYVSGLRSLDFTDPPEGKKVE